MGGVLLAALTTTTAVSAPASTSVSTSVSASAPAAADKGPWTVEDAEAFWTSRRMESATPAPTPEGDGRGGTEAPAAAPAEVSAALAPRAAASGTYYKGSKTIGVLYYVDNGLASHHCTASVVHSPKGNVILTAGHCGNGSKYAFVPQYRTGKPPAGQPHGIWAVDRVFKDPRRTDTGPGANLDFAFATVKPDERGRQVEQVTGANTLTRTPGYQVSVTVIGYPKVRYDPKDQAVKCRAKTTRLAGYRQLRMKCGGFHGGTSGSPWLLDYDEATRTGKVVGNLGGAGGGGATSDVSYSPYYDNEVFRLYQDAVDNVATVKRPPLPHSPGTGETWQHAKRFASGDYTGDGKADLIVVWTDGEVTLHTGDGKGGFSGERRLKAPNGTWKHATAVTGGDFTGSRRSDLMVRWSDGEVTLHPDVSATGLGREIELARAKSTWKHATQITAGRFTGNGRPDDLIVRWSDGEVTLYSDVDGRGFKKENRLKKPNSTWKHATLLTTGDFTGTTNWDLIVRWSDGERTLYQDVTATRLGKETRMQAPNARWKQAKAMTAGRFTANGRPDDLIVRWADGEVTLYADTSTRLGAARTLVPPKTS
ncbi:trypsin-like serine peptidase [Streptomyces alboflavus]|nr:FG-GAP-like repeat-containing protein [Streptomyces alboflavus]